MKVDITEEQWKAILKVTNRLADEQLTLANFADPDDMAKRRSWCDDAAASAKLYAEAVNRHSQPRSFAGASAKELELRDSVIKWVEKQRPKPIRSK